MLQKVRIFGLIRFPFKALPIQKSDAPFNIEFVWDIKKPDNFSLTALVSFEQSVETGSLASIQWHK